jgi:hypothetical protein
MNLAAYNMEKGREFGMPDVREPDDDLADGQKCRSKVTSAKECNNITVITNVTGVSCVKVTL